MIVHITLNEECYQQNCFLLNNVVMLLFSVIINKFPFLLLVIFHGKILKTLLFLLFVQINKGTFAH